MKQAPTGTVRETRVPLFVQAVTEPLLPECWTVNVSQSGVGLVAAGAADQLAVGEGGALDVTFQLPGADAPIRIRGRVMWTYGRASHSGKGLETALGVKLEEMAAPDRAVLRQFVLEHRPHVAVAFAEPEDVLVLRRACRDTELHFVDGDEGLAALAARGDVAAVVLWASPDRSGSATVDRMVSSLMSGNGARLLPPDLMPLVVYCGPGPKEDLVPLVNSGRLFRMLRRPVLEDELRVAVEGACRAYGERTEHRRAAHALERALVRQSARGRIDAAQLSTGRSMVAESPAMREVLARAGKVAPHKVSVLVMGETGTGKEVLANLVHELSPRAKAPLVIQDCGTLPETLLESELFGHVKGAFTGAVSDNPGLFVVADGGTVFLDEIENTSPELQAKLLRVIETGAVRAVGDTRVRHVDVRVIAATNRELAAEVAAGRFRPDLFYRLNIFPVRLPPLRSRREDILPLARRFLELSNGKLGRAVPGLTPETEEALLAYGWPGNVRELRNTIEAAVLLSEDDQPLAPHLLSDALRPHADARARGPRSLRERVRNYERELIHAALVQSGGILRRAARSLGMNAVSLRRKALAYGIDAHRMRDGGSVSASEAGEGTAAWEGAAAGEITGS